MNWVNPTALLFFSMVVLYLQTAINLPRAILGAQIDLIPLFVVYAAVRFDVATFSLLALGLGLASDSVSANPLGISIIPLWLLGLCAWRVRDLILRDQSIAQMILGGLTCLFAPACVLLLLVTLMRHPQSGITSGPDPMTPIELSMESIGPHNVGPIVGWGTLWQFTVMTVAGAVSAPVVFRLFDALGHRLNYAVVAESTFRHDREIVRGRTRR